ncbi:unnamed protein product [Caenorhabditis sp. 36 PRJEB53466]|nr:unnamed protein product [Caenorhabditis sp. 36 PRJEB53466]
MDRNFTETELENIVNQMGQHVETQAQLHRLKNEIDRYLDEDPYISEEDDHDVMNESLFASLAIDPAAQFLRRERQVPHESIQSPIVSRRRRGKFNEYENIEYPDDFDEESSPDFPEAKSLISQAYQSIGRIYNTCRGASKVIESLSSGERESEYGEEEEEGEDIGDSVSVPVSARTDPRAPSVPAKIIVDPSVRPVLSPKPGRAPYKFDPVTRYHLYKEEWDRHPAPGEMRRLSLRWKVREYMLRHDVPRLTANPSGQAEHDKDWSPRPYLD